MVDERSAGVRKEERLAAGLGSAGIVKAARKEIDSTYRVYQKQWLRAGRGECESDVRTHFEENYEGRLHDEDWSIDPCEDGTWVLQTKRWNVAAEWKREGLAESYAAAMIEEGADPDEVVVVARNSRLEHVLTSYGVLKVRSSGSATTTSAE